MVHMGHLLPLVVTPPETGQQVRAADSGELGQINVEVIVISGESGGKNCPGV